MWITGINIDFYAKIVISLKNVIQRKIVKFSTVY